MRKDKDYISIGEASKILGICSQTLRLYESKDPSILAFKTLGGHRRYKVSKINRLKEKMKGEVNE